jgi:hypothetical protein
MPGRLGGRFTLPVKSALLPVLVVGLIKGSDFLPFSREGGAAATGDAVFAPSNPSVDSAPDSTGMANDVRIHAFLEAYGALIESVSYPDGDVVFTMAGRPIHFQDGRMLGKDRLGEVKRSDPIFYRYPLEPLLSPLPFTDPPSYSTDYLEALFGRTEAQVRKNCRSASFLGHRVFVNTRILGPLREVEGEIRQAASFDPEVAEWMERLDIVYSFIFRDIAHSQTRSLHGFGLALDLVPASYGGRQVYWRWSRVLNRQDWHQTPLNQRWSPPQAVIEAFEHHGFVWGGKWSHFDTIHFEYRPEILLYNRLLRDPRAALGH